MIIQFGPKSLCSCQGTKKRVCSLSNAAKAEPKIYQKPVKKRRLNLGQVTTNNNAKKVGCWFRL